MVNSSEEGSPRWPEMTQWVQDGGQITLEGFRALDEEQREGVLEYLEEMTLFEELEINGIGYRAAKQGKDLVLNIGYSHNVVMPEIDGITIEVPGPNKIIVSGPDKQKVGQFAAEIRGKRPPEPYKGKGIKYVDEVIRRKEGKAGKGK